MTAQRCLYGGFPATSNTTALASSLLFALDEGGGGPAVEAAAAPVASTSARTCSLSDHIKAVKERVSFFATPASAFATALAKDVEEFRAQEDDDAVALAGRLAAVGYQVSVRTALGGSNHFNALRYEFLLVRATGDFEGVEFVVDLAFREQFRIPNPTPEYAEVLTAAPRTFVGPTSRLMPVVQAMCAEMAQSFEVKGLALPPWRKAASMLSKWMPAKARDVRFESPAGASSRSLRTQAQQPLAHALQQQHLLGRSPPGGGGGDSSSDDDSSTAGTSPPASLRLTLSRQMSPETPLAANRDAAAPKVTFGFAL